MKIEDERGHPWVVLSGDSSYSYIKKLKALGYEYIVLPRLVLCGTIQFPPHELPLWQAPSPPSNSPEGVVRAFRLAECLSVLGDANG